MSTFIFFFFFFSIFVAFAFLLIVFPGYKIHFTKKSSRIRMTFGRKRYVSKTCRISEIPNPKQPAKNASNCGTNAYKSLPPCYALPPTSSPSFYTDLPFMSLLNPGIKKLCSPRSLLSCQLQPP